MEGMFAVSLLSNFQVMSVITRAAIEEAHKRIEPFIHRTPVLTCKTIDALAGASLYFKCENFQKIGAFKIRGGMNATLSLTEAERSKGLCTHSSGNHAQAIAFAAREVGTKAYIVMPENSPKVKVNAVQGYGAEVHFCAPNQQARESTVQQIMEKTGATFIHPYDNYEVITGQATAAKELIEDHGPFDIIMAPVGGGGLLSGTSLSAHFFTEGTTVLAGEPEGAADAILSFKSGQIEKAPFINTIADGLLTTLGEKTLLIIREYVKDILLADEDGIKAALKLVYERMKIVVEPSCVVPLAALLRNKELFAGKKVGIILSGGNIDLKKLSDWM